MPTDGEQFETDDRFPTGEWTGFYVQPDSQRRFVMELLLTFERQRISGRGDDSVGVFTISGLYDTKTAGCSWKKQYIGQHIVEYTGQARARGIVGQWHMPGQVEAWTGPFFVWPKEMGDLSGAFERAFMEYDLASELAGSFTDAVDV